MYSELTQCVYIYIKRRAYNNKKKKIIIKDRQEKRRLKSTWSTWTSLTKYLTLSLIQTALPLFFISFTFSVFSNHLCFFWLLLCLIHSFQFYLITIFFSHHIFFFSLFFDLLYFVFLVHFENKTTTKILLLI